MSAACRSCGASIVWADRFWSKVDCSGECWVWTASCNTHGYGSFWLNGKNVGAHIVSYEMAHGPVPDGLQVLHHCDNRPCVRPDHLYTGTHQQNMDDRGKRGRAGGNFTRGEQRKIASLKDCEVMEIRRRYRPRVVTLRQLANEYGVPMHVIADVVTRRTWRHL